MLPDGAVCKACNNRLNSEVDEPMKRMAQPFLNLFGVASSKTGLRGNGVKVLAVVAGREISARFYSNGSIGVTPGPVTPAPILVGADLRWEFRASAQQQIDDWISARLKEGWSWASQEVVDEDARGVILRELSFEGKALVAFRAAAQTGLNYLVHRSATLATEPSAKAIRRFALTGEFDAAEMSFESNVDPSNTLDPATLAPTHLVAIGTDGQDCILTLILFSVFAFKLTFRGALTAQEFHFEHAFDAVIGSDVVGDYWGKHPQAFVVTAAGDCEGATQTRLRRTDGIVDANTQYVHEVLQCERWVRCPKCSGPNQQNAPTGKGATECHSQLLDG